MQRTQPSAPMKVMLYSHDSVGLGHTRRNYELAHALANRLPELTGRAVTGLLVSGLSPTTQLPHGFDTVRLPALKKVQKRYRPRHLQLPLDEVVELREAVLKATVRELEPDLLIVDRHPLGIRGELLSSLRRLRRTRPSARIVLGLRDVLDAPDKVAAEWRALSRLADLSDLIDAVWIFGDPDIHDLRDQLPKEIAAKATFTGYLAQGRSCAKESAEQPYVLTTVGGGADGLELCRAAAAAKPPAGHRHLVVTGPQMDEADRRAVRVAAGPSTTVLDTVPDAHGLIRRAAAVISMGGYNSACEILNSDTPALLVPRERPRLEQRTRAEAFAAQGLVDWLPVGELHPTAVTKWLATHHRDVVDRQCADQGGLARVPHLAASLLTGSCADGAGLAV